MEKPNIKELESFTLKSYTNLLQYLKQTYKIVPFREAPAKNFPYLILRHDVDISPLAALKMAQIERDLGIKSTYFVMFSNRFYNLFEGNNAHILNQISKLGHEIGLHYHPFQFRSYNQNMNKTLEIEIKLLEHLLGRKVHSIARHGYWDRDPFASIKEYINANHPYFRGDLFIHDSCRIWTPPEGLNKLLNNHPQRVQLLTHPENWTEEKMDREILRQKCLKILTKELREGMDRWLKEPSEISADRSSDIESFANRSSMRSGLDAYKPTSKMKLKRELSHYNVLFRWHIVNTSPGWCFHKTIEKLRFTLKKKVK
ncbi:MAG: hypothetical protein QW279_14580 [Candidatus Jordarchaeaceae archaeon]